MSGSIGYVDSIVLGVVEGLTEFLPVSSSGHLLLGQYFLGLSQNRFGLPFDVALHLGTLVAVIAYFWADVVRYVQAWFGSVRRRAIATVDERIAWYVFAATIPAALAGAAGESFIEDKLGQPWQIAIFLAVFAVLLWLADRRPERAQIRDLDARRAFLVGVAQILALAPGVSRSGITITTARFMGLTRDAAARF